MATGSFSAMVVVDWL